MFRLCSNRPFQIIACLLLVLTFLAGCSTADNQQTNGQNTQSKGSQGVIPLYTAGSGGAAYILGGGISTIVSKYVPGVRLSTESTAGSVEMIKLLDERNQQGKAAFAVIASDGVYNGFNGRNEFDKAYPSLRAVSFLYGAELYLVVPKKSPIKTYADVKGKRIGVGAPGSTVATLASLLIEKSGVSKDQYKPLPLGYEEVVAGLKDGSIDGGFLAGATPVANYNDLSSEKEVRIIPVDDNLAQTVLKDNPFYYMTKVKAGSYKGLDNDVPVMAFGVLIAANEKTSDDLVNNTIKTLMDKHDELVAIHKTAQGMTKETLLQGVSIPFHPGAEKYFKEIGIKK